MENSNPRPRFDSHDPHSSLGQKFLKVYRPVCRFFGFKKGYNLPLYIIFVGALLGFCCARVMYLDVDGIFARNSIPGEWYWYQRGHRHIGITIHLVGVLVGGFLACLQFTPVIRHKAILVHRITGYFAITALVLGIVGAFMIMDTAVGGSPALRLWVGFVGAGDIVALLLAYINIKRLQIDQHRAWMIRTWAWAANIISLRLILLAGLKVCHNYNIHYASAISCKEIFFMYENVGIPARGNPTNRLYPACGANAATNPLEVLVTSAGNGPEQVAVLMRQLFVMAAWLAISLHVLTVEIYLWLTPAESYRLRVVSYRKQVERGWRKVGHAKDAGIGATRFGDAPQWWSLPEEDYRKTQHLNDTRKQDAAYDRANIAEANVQEKPNQEDQAGGGGTHQVQTTDNRRGREQSSGSDRTLDGTR